MALGIKVSQPGKDVKTCPDKDLVISSEWNTFKIEEVLSGSLNVGASSSASKEINHSLGRVPFWMMFWEIDGENQWYAEGMYKRKPTYKGYCDCEVYSDKVKIICWNPTGSSQTRNFKIFLTLEKAES